MFFLQRVLLSLLLGTYFLCEKEVSAWPSFLDSIPNGRNVTHPCFPNSIWSGVGHLFDGGGGETNQFGNDFEAASFVWTKALCQKDSDNDGLTNGQELGDPNCVWTPGSVPFRTTNISHPGVCNPCRSAQCNATNQIFGPGLYTPPYFDCPATQANGNFTRDYRLKLTQVPPVATTYICQAIEISTNETLFMIANEPLVNNSNVLHHMLAFGCPSRPDQSKFDQPYQCFMGDSQCKKLVAIWGYGFKGECLDQNIHVNLGNGSFPYMILQLHWNNPLQESKWQDNSGFRFHFSSTRRPYEAGMMIIGQQYLELPPGRISFNATSNCSGNVTKLIFPQGFINVTAAVPHMHLQGLSASIEQYRNGVKVDDLVPYQQALYSNPPFLQFSPKTIQSGDDLRMVCTYATIGVNNTIFYGESTSDEMCFGFLRYYPRIAGDDTGVSFGPYSINSALIPQQLASTLYGCNIASFLLTYAMNNLSQLQMSCPLDAQACQIACKPIVQTLLQNPCMQGWPRKFMLFMSKYSFNIAAGVTSQNVIWPLTLYSSQCETALRLANQTATTAATSFGFSTGSQLALLIAGAVVAFALLLLVSLTLLVKALCIDASPSKANVSDEAMSSHHLTEPTKNSVYGEKYSIQRVF